MSLRSVYQRDMPVRLQNRGGPKIFGTPFGRSLIPRIPKGFLRAFCRPARHTANRDLSGQRLWLGSGDSRRDSWLLHEACRGSPVP